MTAVISLSNRQHLVWIFCGIALAVLLSWIPGLKYPIVSDTMFYAYLGKSFWTEGSITLLGQPYAKHLPLWGILGYPFVALFGYSVGMKVATLLAGLAVLGIAFGLLQELFGRTVAVIATALLSLHHAFVLMLHLASADLPFTALFLLSIWMYIRAERNDHYYIAAFVAAGFACLVRYNGMPLFALFGLHVILFRRKDLQSTSLWSGVVLGSTVFGAWLLRNFLVFGDPLHTTYTGELSSNTPSYAEQLITNVVYYLRPEHNLLPILFVCALWGLWLHARQHGFLVASIAAAWVFTAIWWVQAMRFAFPAYPLLMGFAVLGLIDIWKRIRFACVRWILVAAIVASHLGALCVYSFGECNALFDSKLGLLPRNLGITSEGFYSWHQAREFLVSLDRTSDRFAVDDALQQDMFAHDEVITAQTEYVLDRCNAYRITQNPQKGDSILFISSADPATSVVYRECDE